MSDTANLHLPFLAQGQAQKHVTINETLVRLDALLQLSVESATTNAEPASPSDGQVYILPAGKSGAHWGAMANCALAYYRDGVWEEIAPREGWRAWARDSDAFLLFTGAAWSRLAGVPAGGRRRRFLTRSMRRIFMPAGLRRCSGMKPMRALALALPHRTLRSPSAPTAAPCPRRRAVPPSMSPAQTRAIHACCSTRSAATR